MKAVYIQTVEELTAVLKTPESLVLEFKTTIDKWNTPKTAKEWEKRRAEGQQETCRDIAQFANTNGGCLLIGVQERNDPVTQLKVADGVCGVSDPEGMKDWIEKAISNYLVPSTFSHEIKEIHDPKGIVLAVNIPPSLHLVALWHSERKSQFEEKHSIEYLYRDSHGKKWMNPDEVERHLMNGSRAARLRFNDAFAEAPQGQVHIAGGCWQRSENRSTGAQDQAWRSAWVTVGLMTDRWFELKFTVGENTLSLNLPYGVIKEAWVGADECLNLLLSIRVVYWKNQLLIEPGP
jgi:hypothetical protein